MNALHEIQTQFLDYLRTENNAIQDQIQTTKQLSKTTRLAIYGNAYKIRLQSTMEEDFPGLFRYLGDTQFQQLADEYIKQTPSQHTSLRWYSQSLAKFLSTTEPYSGVPLLAELAEYEYTLRIAFDAENANPLNHTELETVAPDDWPNLTFRVLPSLRRCQFLWNTVEIWQALQTEQTPDDPRSTGELSDWMIWRPELQTLYRSLAPIEAKCLNLIQQGGRFSQMCERLDALEIAQPATMAAQMLEQWIDDEILYVYTVSPR